MSRHSTGDGNGNFHRDELIPLGTGQEQPSAVTAGDFNGDGNLDLAVADSERSNDRKRQHPAEQRQPAASPWSRISSTWITTGTDHRDQAERQHLPGSGGELSEDQPMDQATAGLRCSSTRATGHSSPPCTIYSPRPRAPRESSPATSPGTAGSSSSSPTGYQRSQYPLRHDRRQLRDVPARSCGILPELGTTQVLQGGTPVNVGPIDATSQITPATSALPDYLGYISLPYYQDKAPLNIYSPDYFLSVTPAEMQQSASGYSYTAIGFDHHGVGPLRHQREAHRDEHLAGALRRARGRHVGHTDRLYAGRT